MADLILTQKVKGIEKVKKYLEFLGFTLEDDLFGVPLKEVMEISKLLTIVPVPFSSPNIKGVINVRGEIIPVLDVKRMLRLQEKKESNRIIIMDTRMGKVGMLADIIKGVVRVEEEKLEPNPMVGKYSAFIRNVAQVEDGLISILDFDRILERV